jgi:hypothetical protein
MHTKSWRLDDAETIAAAAKYTFYKPSRYVLDKLEVGNLVKLIFAFDNTEPQQPNAERMWVIITEKSNGKFVGTLDNEPYFIKDLNPGDTIEFEEKHIINSDLDEVEPSLVDKYIHRCLVSNKILAEGCKVKYLMREESLGEYRDGIVDSGWRILAGDESQEYLDDPENTQFVSLGAVLNQDDTFLELLEEPIGAAFEWLDELNRFERVS